MIIIVRSKALVVFAMLIRHCEGAMIIVVVVVARKD